MRAESGYSSHRLFFIVCLVALILPALGIALVLLGFMAVGLSHGAFDVALLRPRREEIAKFVALYFAIGIIFCVLAVVSPTSATWVFIIVSAYHFGLDVRSGARFGKNPLITSVAIGLCLFLCIYLGHASETARVFKAISRGQLTDALDHLVISRSLVKAQGASQATTTLIGLTIFIPAVFNAVFRMRLDPETAKKVSHIGLFSLLLVLPPLIGFGAFFVYWHSLDAFESQRAELGLGPVAALKASAPLTLGALLILLLGCHTSQSALTALFGALSVAHVLTRSIVG